MSQPSIVPRAIISLISYDGPSVFLQGQNGISMNVEGMVYSNVQLHQVSFNAEVIGTFRGAPRPTTVKMELQGEPTIHLLPFYGVPGAHLYQFKATFLSAFSTLHSGDCYLTANFTFGPFMCVDNVTLRSVSVVSILDQDNNRARRVGRYTSPPTDFDSEERIGDQGPGIFSCPAEESSFLIDPPVRIPEIGDQGPGEYLGRGEDADWPDRAPSPTLSCDTTISNTESISDTESIPDTESVGGPVQETIEVEMEDVF